MALALALLACLLVRTDAAQAAVNPLSQVLGLLGELKAKIQKGGEREAQAYKEYFDWCGDVQAAAKNELKVEFAEKEKEEADVEESTSTIQDTAAKIEKTAADISGNDAELKDAAEIREKERTAFLASEKELTDVLDTIDRATAKLKTAGPASLAQIAQHGAQTLVSTLGLMAEAASLSSLETQKLVALAQTHASQSGALEDDSAELGAPAAAVYESKSGSILELLEDLKEKATAELSDLRKSEAAAQHEYEMLRQSLKDENDADTKELKEEKTIKAEASEEKSDSEGELEVLLKELPIDQRNLEEVITNCERKEADHEATVKSREAELKAVDEATKIIQEATGGASEKTYSLLQLSAGSRTGSQLRTRADLAHVEALTLVKRLAQEHHSAALAQLAMQMSSVMRTAAAAGADPFAKVKGLIKDLISKLEAEAASESSEKSYCDDEMGKTSEKKDELTEDLDKVTSKIDKAVSKVAKLKDDVSELQSELAKLAASQSEMDKIREQSHADYVEAQADLEKGLNGVRRALGVLRDYYSQDKEAAAMLQTSVETEVLDGAPPPERHSKASGAGAGIISLLEVVESDFADNLAKEETEESESAEEYEKVSQDNKVSTASKSSAVKLKTKAYTGLEKSITEHKSDRDGLSSELDAVTEYDTKLKERCIGKPESYEERKARREAEIKGLKEALKLLSVEASFAQRGKYSLHRVSDLESDRS